MNKNKQKYPKIKPKIKPNKTQPIWAQSASSACHSRHSDGRHGIGSFRLNQRNLRPFPVCVCVCVCACVCVQRRVWGQRGGCNISKMNSSIHQFINSSIHQFIKIQSNSNQFKQFNQFTKNNPINKQIPKQEEEGIP